MKKTLTLFLLMFICVGMLSGCWWGKKEEDKNQNQLQEQFTNIRDAINSGKKLKCTYTFSYEGQEGMKTTIYMQGNKYRTEFDIEGKKQISLFDGKTHYSWGLQDSKGFKMDRDCMEELSSNATTDDSSEFDMESSFVDDDEFERAMDVKCGPVSSIDLSVPSNIEFTDQCELMKQAQEQMKEIEQKLDQLEY